MEEVIPEAMQNRNDSSIGPLTQREQKLGAYKEAEKSADSQILQPSMKMNAAMTPVGRKGLLHNGEKGKAPCIRNT